MYRAAKTLRCFFKDANPSLVDVIFTNRPTSCGTICNFDRGISDVHNIISVQFKSEMPQKSKSKSLFRSYKNFDNENVIKDLNELNLDFFQIFLM